MDIDGIKKHGWTPEETKRERMLHAIYDAWQWLEREAAHRDGPIYAGPSRAILRGQLEAAQYEPYLRYKEQE